MKTRILFLLLNVIPMFLFGQMQVSQIQNIQSNIQGSNHYFYFVNDMDYFVIRNNEDTRMYQNINSKLVQINKMNVKLDFVRDQNLANVKIFDDLTFLAYTANTVFIMYAETGKVKAEIDLSQDLLGKIQGIVRCDDDYVTLMINEQNNKIVYYSYDRINCNLSRVEDEVTQVGEDLYSFSPMGYVFKYNNKSKLLDTIFDTHDTIDFNIEYSTKGNSNVVFGNSSKAFILSHLGEVIVIESVLPQNINSIMIKDSFIFSIYEKDGYYRFNCTDNKNGTILYDQESEADLLYDVFQLSAPYLLLYALNGDSYLFDANDKSFTKLNQGKVWPFFSLSLASGNKLLLVCLIDIEFNPNNLIVYEIDLLTKMVTDLKFGDYSLFEEVILSNEKPNNQFYVFETGYDRQANIWAREASYGTSKKIISLNTAENVGISYLSNVISYQDGLFYFSPGTIRNGANAKGAIYFTNFAQTIKLVDVLDATNLKYYNGFIYCLSELFNNNFGVIKIDPNNLSYQFTKISELKYLDHQNLQTTNAFLSQTGYYSYFDLISNVYKPLSYDDQSYLPTIISTCGDIVYGKINVNFENKKFLLNTKTDSIIILDELDGKGNFVYPDLNGGFYVLPSDYEDNYQLKRINSNGYITTYNTSLVNGHTHRNSYHLSRTPL